MAVDKLVARLGPDFGEEDNMNSSTILQDLVDRKEFINHILKKDNI
jgi:hypothetical protein